MEASPMTPPLEEARQALQQSSRELLDRRNVVAVGVGRKTVAGRRTDQVAIVCSVEAKQPRSALDPRDLIPQTVEGVPTDVVSTGPIFALQVPTGRFRPAPGGVSIGHFGITAGTLGCLVRKDGQLHILSNNHVLANSNNATVGDAVLQPGAADGGSNPGDRIATLREWIPIEFDGGGGGGGGCAVASATAGVLNAVAGLVGSRTRLRPERPGVEVRQAANLVDCAIARPENDDDVVNEILQLGAPAGTAEGTLGMAVRKSGRTTGLTTGTIQQVDVTVRVGFGAGRSATFVDQLLAGPMSQGGDSGSAVVNQANELVGLLFAGSVNTTIFNRIQNVFQLLQVTLP